MLQSSVAAPLSVPALGVLALMAGAAGCAEPRDPPAVADCPPLDAGTLDRSIQLQNEGIDHYQRRQTAQAIRTLEAALALDPCSASIHNDLAIAHHQKLESDRAVALLDKAIALDPLYANSYLNLAIIHQDHGRFPEAAAAGRKFVDLRPEVADARLHLGVVLVRMNEFDAAQAELEKAAELDPGDAEIWFHLGSLAFRGQEQPERAAEFYRKALEANPIYAEAHYRLALTLQSLGRAEEAQEHFDEFERLAKHQGRLDQFNRTLRANRDRAGAVDGLFGHQYSALGRFEEAVVRFERAIELDPGNADHHSGLADAYRQLRRYDDALQAAFRARELDPDLLAACDSLMAIYRERNEIDKAIQVVREVRDKHPEYHPALLNLGILLAEGNRYQEALEALGHYLELDPANLLAHEVVLHIFTQTGDASYVDAEKVLEHAEMAERLESRRYDLLAASFRIAGQPERADEWQKKARSGDSTRH